MTTAARKLIVGNWKMNGAMQPVEVVGAQIRGSVPDGFHGGIAYEPVWAIGTGRSAHVEDIAQMHAFIRAQLEGIGSQHKARGSRVLYGGSVKAENAEPVLAIQSVDGARRGEFDPARLHHHPPGGAKSLIASTNLSRKSAQPLRGEDFHLISRETTYA